MLLKGTMKPYSSTTDRHTGGAEKNDSNHREEDTNRNGKSEGYDNPAIGLDAVGFGAERFICY
jgi:hypothetical protein